MKMLWETLKRKNLLELLFSVLMFATVLVVWAFSRRTEHIVHVLTVIGLVLVLNIVVYTHKKHVAKVDPEAVHKQSVEERDERNIMIRNHSTWQIFCVSKGLLFAVGMLFFLLGEQIMFVFWGIAIALDLIFYALRRYNNRKL